jgi:hypothetical protein
MKQAAIQTAFNAGEWSPLMEGQVNLQKRSGAVSLLQNMIPLKQGPAVRRGGTKFVKEIKTSANRTALIDFIFGKLTTGPQAYQIEAGDQYFRFYRNNAPIKLTAQDITAISKANPGVVTYSGSDTYANGNEVYISGVLGMTEVNGRYYKVANVDTGANTFELTDVDGNNVDTSGYTTYSSAGTVEEIYTVTSPYTQANLFDANNLFLIQHAQSADVLYQVHGLYKPYALTRSGHAVWTHTAMTLNDGPYLDINTTATTLTPSGGSYAPGDIPTVTASSIVGINDGTGFQTTDVGRVIRIKNSTNWAWGTITTRTSTTVVTVTVGGTISFPSSAQTLWRLGVYSDTTGWPRVVTFHQNRFVLMGCTNYPDRYDLSKTGGYSATELLFAPSDADGTVTDDAAIYGTLQSGQINAIQWAASNEKGLFIGTTHKEWVLRADETNARLTPTNQKADVVDDKGGAYIKPIEAEGGAVFVQDARRKIMFAQYSFESDRIVGDDLTLFAEHITRGGILGMAYQQEPVNAVWAWRADGLLLEMTFYPGQEVLAWSRHPIGGDGIVESVSVIPSADGLREEVWMIVKRTINGVTRRYIEYMTRYYEDDIDLEDAICVDSAITYDSTATATITGLDHLEGKSVNIFLNGRAQNAQTVSDGEITLANGQTGTVIQIGLPCPWAIKSLQPEAGAANGTAQGKTKKIIGAVFRLLNTLGLKYGKPPTDDSITLAEQDGLDEEDFDQGQAFDETPELYTGDTKFKRWPAGYETDGRYFIGHAGAFPACVSAVMIDVETQDRG